MADEGEVEGAHFESGRAAFDGFREAEKGAFVGYRPTAARVFWERAADLADRLGATLEGAELVPDRGVLFVANHAFGWDVALALALLRRANGRVVWVLGEHLWWRVPFLRVLASSVGVVDGTPENVDRLLSRGEQVLVLPGGLREALKPRELRYRLVWGKRYGFVRAALRHGVPIVPLATFGADEWFDWVGDPFERGRRWLGPLGITGPLPRPWAGLPWVHPVRPKYVLGEPVLVPHEPSGEHDTKTLRRLRREVEGALYELIDDELVRRAGFDHT